MPAKPPAPTITAVEIRTNAAADRLDSFVASQVPSLSRSRIQALIREQYIVVDGNPAKPRDPVRPGQTIFVAIPEAVPAVAQAQEIALSVLHEDEDLVVIDKSAGMVVHPAPGNPDGTVVNALLHHCRGKLSGIGGVERPGIVHRLDKDTSGCLVVAKSEAAHHSLVDQFSQRTSMRKQYLAVTIGTPRPPRETIFTHIGRHPQNRLKMSVVTPPGGKPAITDYRVLATREDSSTSLVLCDLHTGRTHQIRVHLHHKGTPLAGDPIYGRPSRHPELPARMMLHAWRLSFLHPSSGKEVSFEAPIPPEFDPWISATDPALLCG